MLLFAGMAGDFQTAPPGAAPNPRADEDKFWKFAQAAIDCAHKLAPYLTNGDDRESPEMIPPNNEIRRFSLGQTPARIPDQRADFAVASEGRDTYGQPAAGNGAVRLGRQPQQTVWSAKKRGVQSRPGRDVMCSSVHCVVL